MKFAPVVVRLFTAAAIFLAFVVAPPSLAAFEVDPDLEYKSIQLEPPLSWKRARALQSFALSFPEHPKAPASYWEYLAIREFAYDAITSSDVPSKWPDREAEWALFIERWPQYEGDWRVPLQRARNELGMHFPDFRPKGDADRALEFLSEAESLAGAETTHKWFSGLHDDIVVDNAGWPDGLVWPVITYHKALAYDHLVFDEDKTNYISLAIELFQEVVDAKTLYRASEHSARMFENAEVRLCRLRRKARPGSATITSSPPKAAVFLSGIAMGETPLELTDLAPGTWTGVIKRPGYERQSFEFLVEANTETVVSYLLIPNLNTMLMNAAALDRPEAPVEWLSSDPAIKAAERGGLGPFPRLPSAVYWTDAVIDFEEGQTYARSVSAGLVRRMAEQWSELPPDDRVMGSLSLWIIPEDYWRTRLLDDALAIVGFDYRAVEPFQFVVEGEGEGAPWQLVRMLDEAPGFNATTSGTVRYGNIVFKKLLTSLADAPKDEREPLHFPDASLEIVIRRAIDRPKGPLYRADVERISDLSAAFSDIQSLEGIEHLLGLQTLDLAHNYISDVTPLAGIKSLVSLDLAGNDVVDVAPLANLPRLENLDVSGNKVTSVAGFEHLRRLRMLDISFNPIGDLEPLRELPALETMVAVGSRLADVDALASIGTLHTVRLDDNAIADAAPLARLRALQHLSLADNAIVDVTPLASLPNLQMLNVDGNEIEDIGSLAAVDSLEMLTARRNRISDIGALGGLPNLRRLDVSGNFIRTVAPSFATADEPMVHVYGNPIDRSVLSDGMVARLFGSLRDEFTLGEYTLAFYESHGGLAYGELRRGGDILWYGRSHTLTLPDDEYFAVVAADVEDVTGDGYPDVLIVEYTGGAHCCTFVHVFQLEPNFRYVDAVAGLHGNPFFRDVDGAFLVDVRDWTFAYWKTSFAQSPAPRVVLRFDGERFRVAPEHMRAAPPDPGEFAALATATRSDDMWQTYKAFRGVLVGPPPRLWAVMLDFIYSGNGDLAFQFLDLAWPDDIKGKDVFAAAFLKQLQTSPYWEDIQKKMYGGVSDMLDSQGR